ncbi:MAG: adenosylcobinamide-GDP ribazoletransferase [Lachnospiraceae bacterium]|nr:adenosylcobinamide-GDP ribazoletransferase [Lachnospiraceae bacterium]
MRLLRSFAVALSMFSKIPVPGFTWKEEDMSHALSFFPVIGVIIGALIVVLNAIKPFSELHAAVRIILTLVIPMIISGGIHDDGFMDTEDALHSYESAEKKLEILKDPHTGAFAVISLIKWMLIRAAAISAVILCPLSDTKVFMILGLIFVVSRCLSGLTSVLFVKAKKEGMLYSFTKDNEKATVMILAAELAAALFFMMYLNLICGIILIMVFAGFTGYYRYKTYKEFGGVTGDTAGWFLMICEILSTFALAVMLCLLSVF